MSQHASTLLIQGVIMVAVVALILIRQMRVRQVTTKQLVRFPLIFAVIGVVSLHGTVLTGMVGDALLAGELALAAVLGLARGASGRVWCSDGIWWSKGTPTTLVLWVVSFAVRIAASAVAGVLGVSASMGTGAIFCFVAATLAAQSVVVARRTVGLGAGHGLGTSAARQPGCAAEPSPGPGR